MGRSVRRVALPEWCYMKVERDGCGCEDSRSSVAPYTIFWVSCDNNKDEIGKPTKTSIKLLFFCTKLRKDLNGETREELETRPGVPVDPGIRKVDVQMDNEQYVHRARGPQLKEIENIQTLSCIKWR